MEPDLDIEYANEMMEKLSELEIADFCLKTGNFFWDLIACIDHKWVPKLFESYVMALRKIQEPEIFEQFLRTSMDALVWRVTQERDLIEQIAKIISDKRFPNNLMRE
jgi:hypothetical protein